MHRILVVSLALYHVTWSRPQDLMELDAGELQEALNNLNLLNQLQISNSILNDESFSKNHNPRQRAFIHMAAPTAAAATDVRPSKAQKVYSDGAFSDIPSDAFQLDHRKEFRFKDANQNRVTKKDLNKLASPAQYEDKVPENLIRTCLDYFQGRSHPKQSSLELILDICNELLDDDDVEDFVLDDESRQKMYNIRANDDGAHWHQLGPGVSVQCEYCPHGHHVMNTSPLDTDDDDGDDDDDDRNDVLRDLLELFKPIGYRREWMVVNAKNPDERMKTYVDLKK